MVRTSVGRIVVSCACVLGLVVAGRMDGRAQAPAKHETFTAKTVNMSAGAGQDLKIDLFRWSSDDERTALIAALKDNNEKALADAIQKAASLGTIWTNESLGYTVRYAYRDTMPNGSERVILATDGRPGSWSGQVWKPLHGSAAADYPFTVIELRLGRGATGEGKMSIAAKVVADDAAKTIALGDYDTSPTLLRPVKHDAVNQK
ncbi:MAG TPA: hypothetical protein VF456_17105 [Vicinamibacterales bacterium]